VHIIVLFHLKSVMLDHFLAKNATAHKVHSYYTLAISYCTFCVGKHTILGPGLLHIQQFVSNVTAVSLSSLCVCYVLCREIQLQLQDSVKTLQKQWTDFMPHLTIIQVCTFL